MANKNPNQCQLIKDYINEFGSITPLEAMADLGIMRLASRISEMKAAGALIISETEHGINRRGKPTHYKRYKFIDIEEGETDEQSYINGSID